MFFCSLSSATYERRNLPAQQKKQSQKIWKKIKIYISRNDMIIYIDYPKY